MRDTVLWRKQSRIIMLLSDTLHIKAERALDLFYSTNVYQQLSDPKYGLQLMSDDYILDELIHVQKDEDDNQLVYHRNILNTLLELQNADEFIEVLAGLIKRLAVDHLHIVCLLYTSPSPRDS